MRQEPHGRRGRQGAGRAILPGMSKKADFTQIAFRVVQKATHQEPAAEEPKPLTPKAAAGRKGGLKGGKARAAMMTAEERQERARKAAQKRWGKEPA
jgi:hypothetical protein